MQTVIQESLHYLTQADIAAMAAYLKDSDAGLQPRVASKVKLRSERLDAGRVLYADHCASCHQADGKGLKASVPSLVANDTVTAAEPSDVVMAILEGFARQGPWGAMGAFGNTLDNEQIADLTNYVRVAWGNQAAANATPWGVAKMRGNAQVPASRPKALLCPSLSAAVMRPALAQEPLSTARIGAMLADFSQRVATDATTPD